MRKLFDIKKFKLYPWIGLAFLLVNLLSDLADHSKGPYLIRALDNAWKISYLLVINYSLFEWALANFRWKRVFRLLGILLVYGLLYSWIFYLWRGMGIALHVYTPLDGPFTRGEIVADMMGYSVGSVIFFAIIRHIYNHIRLRRTAQQLLIEKQQAELNYLKSQTNPHFLFNTLNNIYSLARDKSDLAPESILRLSKILRYMLYETSGPYTAIEQDLKIIGDYIALEQLRYDDSLRVNFNYDIEDMRQALPPLLLIPLVENAFKHGVSETRGQPFVDMHLSVKNRQLYFIVKNSTGEPAGEEQVRESIGLSNLRRQLQLLYTDYDLALRQESFVFNAALKINLASHV
jgi:sensor histidine kinase YesM